MQSTTLKFKKEAYEMPQYKLRIFTNITLEVQAILHYLEVPSGVKLTLLCIDGFSIFLTL